jgi:hypothetical protein
MKQTNALRPVKGEKRPNKNNYKKDENKAKSHYKLWVSFKAEAMAAHPEWKYQVQKYFSNNYKSAKEGYKDLVNRVVKKYENDYIVANMYDNHTGELLESWPKQSQRQGISYFEAILNAERS